MMAFLNPLRRSERVSCTIEIEQTIDNLFAHVVLDGIEVRPGDEVLVHDAPEQIGFGTRIRCRRLATVRRAGRIKRIWTRLRAPMELTALYEVGFMPRRQS
jgi:hypothetical protein